MNFLELVKARYSVRKYDSRPVEAEKMAYVLECVRMAPSAVNFQPWKFVVVSDQERLAGLRECYNREWFASAPCVVVACSDHSQSWHRQSDGKDHADIDIAIAVEHLCLAAAEQGLGTCWVCNFDAAKCKAVLRLGDDVEPAVLVPIGYSADTFKEKKRKALSEIVD